MTETRRFWLSGGTGFVGGALAKLLRAKGHEVVALARSTSDTRNLRELGAEIRVGDVTEPETLAPSMEGCDAGFHVAAWYEVGVTDRDKMFAINVDGTRNVLDAVRAAKLPKLVYCSTCAALGWHAPGELPDETYENPTDLGSWYAESKYEAHRLVREAAAGGLPVVTAMPGGIYGPGDPSMVGTLIRYTVKGWMRASILSSGEFTFLHIDDAATGLYLAWEKGTFGEEYVIGGEPLTIRGALERVALAAGRKPPRFSIPTGALKAMKPLSGPFVKAMGMGPRALEEGITTVDGKSWAYSWDKAARELGYRPRPFDEGIRETVAAMGGGQKSKER